MHVSESVGRYMVDVVTATRTSGSAAVGASPRGSLALLKLSRCKAALAGRDFVTPDDVKAIGVPALAHRLVLKPELWVQRLSAEDVVREVLESVPTPPAEDVPAPRVTRRASPRLAAYAALAAIGLAGALALRRPELAALATPFAALLALGLVLASPPTIRAWLTVARERVLEGDEVDAELELNAESSVERLEVLLALPQGVRAGDGQNPVSVRLGREEERTLPLQLACERWGTYTLGSLHLRARDRLGLFTWEARVERPHVLRVYPRPERLRAVLAPLETQAYTGNEVARVKGDGLEFADIRPFVVGDRLRSINWRASARRNELVVNERHPERNTDVVVFLDSFAEARTADESTLDRAVRAAATVAALYLERRDRVGLVTFGGILRWLEAGSGLQQRYRLVDALLETEVEFSYAWKDVNVIPARLLPPKAVVLAVTPLLDPRSIGALLDLRARGYDLAVVEVSPVPFVRARQERDRRARAPPLAPSPRGGASALRATRSRRRDLGRRHAARRGHRGGEGISASRASRASVGAALAAVAASAGLTVWLALEPAGPSRYGAGAAGGLAVLVLATGLLLGWAATIPSALLLLGGGYALFLAVEDVALDLRAAGVAATLLVIAELAYWSLELRADVTDEPGSYGRRVAILALLGLGAMALTAGLLALVDVAGRGGVAIEIAGACAALASLLLCSSWRGAPIARRRGASS